MSERGPAYPRTTWAYGERPVTAAKLNAWDAHVANAFELTWRLLNHAFGGGDGIVPELRDGMRVVAQTPPGNAARVLPGCAFINGMPFFLTTPVDTPVITPPEAEPRIDLVQARLEDWTLAVKTGAESTSPIAPAPDPGCLVLAFLRLRPGMTVIMNVDDGVNGWIEDGRVLLGAS